MLTGLRAAKAQWQAPKWPPRGKTPSDSRAVVGVSLTQEAATVVSQTWNLKLVGNPTDSFTSAQELNLNPNFAV